MSVTITHAETVLGGILPDRVDRLQDGLRLLDQDVFPKKEDGILWTVLSRYLDITGAVLSRKALDDTLSKQPVGTRLLFGELFDRYCTLGVDDASFKWSCLQLLGEHEERQTEAAFRSGLKILATPETDEGDPGGAEAARQVTMERLASIGRVQSDRAPEGNVRTEASEILKEYESLKLARLSGTSSGLQFGIPSLDALLGGLQPGELDLIAGYSGSGKSNLAVQLAWNVVVNQGLNVVFLTTETLRPQVRRRIIARHSCLPKFGLARGINNRDLKRGDLNPSEEAAFQAVVGDFQSNPNYGVFHLAQVPRGATLDLTEAHLERLSGKFPVDLVVMDYLALWKSGRKRSSDREELSGIIKAAKEIAGTHKGGKGTTVVSPWQVNRSSAEEARRTGHYTSAATAETAEATNTADILVSVLAMTDAAQRDMELRVQALKNRDGETSSGLSVMVDYGTSRFSDAPMGVDGVLAPAGLSGLL